MNKAADTVPSTEYDYDWDASEASREAQSPRTRRRSRVAYGPIALIAAIIVLAGMAAGLAGGLLLPATHAARAEILYPITEELPTGFLREDRNLTTQLVYMQSRAVLAPAAVAEGIPLEQLEDQVTISLLDSSEIIRIEVRDHSPATAMRLVEHISDTYLELAQTSPESNALRFVESELADVEVALAETRQQLTEHQAAGGSEQISDQIDAEISDLRIRARALRRMQDDIQVIERSEPTAELITQPYVLDSPVNPTPLVLGAAGALTGLVLASCVVAVLVRRQIRG